MDSHEFFSPTEEISPSEGELTDVFLIDSKKSVPHDPKVISHPMQLPCSACFGMKTMGSTDT